jgi:hypothetical protein
MTLREFYQIPDATPDDLSVIVEANTDARMITYTTPLGIFDRHSTWNVKAWRTHLFSNISEVSGSGLHRAS